MNLSRKMVLILCLVGMGIQTYGQEKESTDKVIWWRNTTFYFTNSFHHGDNMIADAHRSYNFGAELKLGIVKYKNVGLTLFTGITRLKVEDTQMIGNVTSSRELRGGATLFYQWNISKKSTFKPEIGIYDLSMRSKSIKTKIKAMSGTGFLIGTNFQYNLTKGFRGAFGLHYHWNKYNVRTAPQYKNYFERAQFIQLSVGFNF